MYSVIKPKGFNKFYRKNKKIVISEILPIVIDSSADRKIVLGYIF